MMPFPRLTPESCRFWLDVRHESQELKQLASDAIDAYKSAAANPNSSASLEYLHFAAVHPSVVVWDPGLSMLSQLCKSFHLARQKIELLSTDRKAEIRRRSIQYLVDSYPRAFCVGIFQALQLDRSAKVRGLAASQVEGLGLKDLLPNLENTLAVEHNETAQFCT